MKERLTAVEWFEQKLDALDIEIPQSIFEQAKEMEQQQMNKNTNFICHGCGTKHTGENDDQAYEVCKQCFTNF